MPTVTICIPTYNHAEFIGGSLRSAMMQKYEDIEIIVLDNASQDETPQIVASISEHDSRVTYIRHKSNIGLVGNLNACISLARGEFVKILCADDQLEPECVSSMLGVMTRYPEISLVACARNVTDANLSSLRVARARAKAARIPGRAMIGECFFFGNRIGEPTAVMFRRADAVRGFSEDYPQLVDMEMWFHLLHYGDFFALPEVLCKIRMHAGQATWENDQHGRIVADRKRLYLQFANVVSDSTGFFHKCLWDFRMAYAVLRSNSARNLLNKTPVSEVFFPKAFALITYPLVRFMRVAGLGLIWRTV